MTRSTLVVRLVACAALGAAARPSRLAAQSPAPGAPTAVSPDALRRSAAIDPRFQS